MACLAEHQMNFPKEKSFLKTIKCLEGFLLVEMPAI